MSQKHNVTPVAIVDTMDQFDEENESAIGIYILHEFYALSNKSRVA